AGQRLLDARCVHCFSPFPLLDVTGVDRHEWSVRARARPQNRRFASSTDGFRTRSLPFGKGCQPWRFSRPVRLAHRSAAENTAIDNGIITTANTARTTRSWPSAPGEAPTMMALRTPHSR